MSWASREGLPELRWLPWRGGLSWGRPRFASNPHSKTTFSTPKNHPVKPRNHPASTRKPPFRFENHPPPIKNTPLPTPKYHTSNRKYAESCRFLRQNIKTIYTNTQAPEKNDDPRQTTYLGSDLERKKKLSSITFFLGAWSLIIIILCTVQKREREREGEKERKKPKWKLLLYKLVTH